MSDTPTHQKSERPDLRDEIRAYRDADDAAHQTILDKLGSYETDLQVANAIAGEKSGAERALRRQMLTLAVAFLSIGIGLVAWVSTEIRDIHRDVAENTAHFREFQAIGVEWGDAIDERAAGFHDDIDSIRKQMHEHQRNSKKHIR
jgi:hypothetical protein